MLMLVDELTMDGTTPEDLVEITSRIQRSGRRMQGLVDGLLALARAGSSAMAPADVDVTAICQDVVADLDRAIAEASASVRIPAAPVVVHGDPTLLRQLLQNLVSNALKFRRAGVAPAVTIDARTLAAGGVEIAVRDNGIGFEPGKADRLFQRFSRLHTGFEGSGIGLATCARIVERHGGSLRAAGEPDLGATFTVTLPAAAAGAPAGTPLVPTGTAGH
jgi:signal transduction histidine kinase